MINALLPSRSVVAPPTESSESCIEAAVLPGPDALGFERLKELEQAAGAVQIVIEKLALLVACFPNPLFAPETIGFEGAPPVICCQEACRIFNLEFSPIQRCF